MEACDVMMKAFDVRMRRVTSDRRRVTSLNEGLGWVYKHRHTWLYSQKKILYEIVAGEWL